MSPRPPAAFRDHKIARLYAHLDTDGDDRLGWDDLRRLAESLLADFGEPADSPQATALVAALRTFWDRMLGHRETAGEGGLSSQEYRAGMQALFVEGPHFDTVLLPVIEAVARLCDTDGDGALGAAEYVRMEGAFGIAAAEAEHAFGRLDLDGDGRLDVDALVGAARVHYTSDR